MDFLITGEIKDLGKVKMTPEQKELLKNFRPYSQSTTPTTSPPTSPVDRMEIDDPLSVIEELRSELLEVQIQRSKLQLELDSLNHFIIPDKDLEAVIVDLMIMRDKINQNISKLKKRVGR